MLHFLHLPPPQVIASLVVARVCVFVYSSNENCLLLRVVAHAEVNNRRAEELILEDNLTITRPE